MPCYRPLKGYRATDGRITFKRTAMSTGQLTQVNCGQCVGCRMAKSKEFAVRCVHEDRTSLAKTGFPGSFLTLTYDDEHLPPGGSVSKKEHQTFIQALRDKLRPDGVQIRYFMCGEYGADEYFEDPEDPTVPKFRLGPGRPHYHYIIFGYNFPDKYEWTQYRGHQYYRSPQLESVWQKGNSIVGHLTPETCAYTTRYVLKKQSGEQSEDHYKRLILETGELYPLQREFALMSLKPGIGKEWFEKYGLTDIYDSGDFVVIDGKKYATPKYYDKLLKDLDERELLSVRSERAKRAHAHSKDSTDRRLRDREELQRLRLRKLVRGLENGSTSFTIAKPS